MSDDALGLASTTMFRRECMVISLPVLTQKMQMADRTTSILKLTSKNKKRLSLWSTSNLKRLGRLRWRKESVCRQLSESRKSLKNCRIWTCRVVASLRMNIKRRCQSVGQQIRVSPKCCTNGKHHNAVKLFTTIPALRSHRSNDSQSQCRDNDRMQTWKWSKKITDSRLFRVLWLSPITI